MGHMLCLQKIWLISTIPYSPLWPDQGKMDNHRIKINYITELLHLKPCLMHSYNSALVT